MLTIAVCDDNPQFAKLLAGKLRQLCAYSLPDRIVCQVEHPFHSADEVLHYLSVRSIHILFLDIDMPEVSGFKLAETLKDRYPETIIIFVSAYDNFVYSSFEYSPFRFLRKSHLEEELTVTFQKVIEKCILDDETMTFQTTEGEVILRLRDILYIEGDKNYFVIHSITTDYRCRGTMTAAEEMTAKYDFFRIHSAYIVNLEQIDRIDDTGIVRMKNGNALEISRRKVAAFRDAYMQFTRRRFAR